MQESPEADHAYLPCQRDVLREFDEAKSVKIAGARTCEILNSKEIADNSDVG